MTKPLRDFAPPTGSFVAGRKDTEFGHLTPEVNSGYALFRQFADFISKLWLLHEQEPKSANNEHFLGISKNGWPLFGINEKKHS